MTDEFQEEELYDHLENPAGVLERPPLNIFYCFNTKTFRLALGCVY